MKNVMTYKDYISIISYSTEDEVFFGKIEGIDDLVNFEGQSVQELKAAFEEAVEDYIETCKNLNKEPLKTYSGTFNIRIDPKLHLKAVKKAICSGISLNKLVEEAIEEKVVGLK
jgi:predicted HicB family RNase H-like nuclease